MRTMSSAMLTAITSGLMRPAIFIQAQFATGTIYIWSGYGTLTWNGHNWTGVGTLIGITAIEEGATLDARGVSLSLSGVQPDILADTLQEFQVGAPVVLYLGMFDNASPPGLLADPIVSWAGNLDQPIIDVDASRAVITINAENRLILHGVDCSERYDQDSQAYLYPGDRGFSFVLGIQNQLLSWGRVPTA